LYRNCVPKNAIRRLQKLKQAFILLRVTTAFKDAESKRVSSAIEGFLNFGWVRGMNCFKSFQGDAFFAAGGVAVAGELGIRRCGETVG